MLQEPVPLSLVLSSLVLIFAISLGFVYYIHKVKHKYQKDKKDN